MKNICVIEDNAAIRKLFSTLLKKGGYNAIDFSDGESAIKEFQTFKPDLIIMDILLPDINGTELIKKVREIPEMKKVPVIAVTGFSTEQDKEKFRELGFSSYMSKPVNTATFLDEISKILG